MIRNRKPIRLRPEIVLTNEEFGHFEVDLIVGTEHKGAILTIVERKTKFLIMRKLSDKKAKSLAKAMIYALLPYKDYVKTITSDNGLEFSEHQYISEKLSCNFILPIRIVLGSEDRVKIPTNLYDNISLRILILRKLAKRRLKKFNIKLTEDRELEANHEHLNFKNYKK